MENRLICICGPTASGKTALSVALAQQLHTEIISADSMQLYRGMDIGTAKPDMKEREGVPHHLFDVCEPCLLYTSSSRIIRLDLVACRRISATSLISTMKVD